MVFTDEPMQTHEGIEITTVDYSIHAKVSAMTLKLHKNVQHPLESFSLQVLSQVTKMWIEAGLQGDSGRDNGFKTMLKAVLF